MRKKLIYLIALCLFTISCNKDKEDCNCGTIVSDDVIDQNGNWCYSLEIRNDCTGNYKSFCFDYDVWLDANPGENFCVTNQKTW